MNKHWMNALGLVGIMVTICTLIWFMPIWMGHLNAFLRWFEKRNLRPKAKGQETEEVVGPPH